MRKNKTLFAGIFLFVTLAAFVVIQLLPRSSSDRQLGKPLLDVAQAARIEKIRLEAVGRTLVIQKKSNGWVLPEENDFPVNISKVFALLEPLQNFKVTQSLHLDAKDYAKVGFDKAPQVFLGDAKGTVLSLGFGSMRKNAGQFVFVKDPSQAYIVDYQYPASMDPSEWGTRDLWQLEESKVQSIKVSFPATPGRKPFTLSRENEHAQWTVSNLSKGKTILNHLRIGFVDTSRYANFAGKKLQKDFPLNRAADIQVEVQTFDDAHYALDLYRFPKAKSNRGTPAWARARFVNRSVASTLPADQNPVPHWKQWYFQLSDGTYDAFDISPEYFTKERKQN